MRPPSASLALCGDTRQEMAAAELGRMANEVLRRWEGARPELRDMAINIHRLLDANPRTRVEHVSFPS